MSNEAWEITTRSRLETQALGRALGALAQPGDLVLLEGDLGSGKTTFVQGFGKGLEIKTSIHSPTFILANEYRGGRLSLYHVDVYRVRSAAEAVGFGLEDYLDADGVVVIEWAEKIAAALPPDHLWIRFTHAGDDSRRLEFRASGARYRQWLGDLAQEAAYAPGH